MGRMSRETENTMIISEIKLCVSNANAASLYFNIGQMFYFIGLQKARGLYQEIT